MSQPQQPDQTQNQMSQPQPQDQPHDQGQPHAESQEYSMLNADGTPAVLPIREEKPLGGAIIKALLIGLGAVLVGAVVWGGLAYLTERIFAFVAIAIGFGVAYGLTLPFKRPLGKAIIAVLVIPAIVFTVSAVLLGDFFYATLLVAKAADTSIGEAASMVGPLFIDFMTEESESLSSVLFGLLGAGFGFYNIVKAS